MNFFSSKTMWVIINASRSKAEKDTKKVHCWIRSMNSNCSFKTWSWFVKNLWLGIAKKVKKYFNLFLFNESKKKNRIKIIESIFWPHKHRKTLVGIFQFPFPIGHNTAITKIVGSISVQKSFSAWNWQFPPKTKSFLTWWHLKTFSHSANLARLCNPLMVN